MPTLSRLPAKKRAGLFNLTIGLISFGYFLFAYMRSGQRDDFWFLVASGAFVIFIGYVLVSTSVQIVWSDEGLTVKGLLTQEKISRVELDFVAGSSSRSMVYYRTEPRNSLHKFFPVSSRIHGEEMSTLLLAAIREHRPDMPQSRAEFTARRKSSSNGTIV